MKKGMTQEEMMARFDQRKKEKAEKAASSVKVITVEAYKDLKAQGLSDRKIGLRYDLDNNAIQKFKRENGLIKTRTESAPQPLPKVEVLPAPVEVATPKVEDAEAPVSTIKDRILQTIDSQIDAQTDNGVGKYSHSLDDCPPEKFDWLQMINEELIDALQYQQKEIGRLRGAAGLSLDKYQQLSARTAVSDDLALLNYGLGISGEAGEVADIIKKQHFHGHSAPVGEIQKELGDVLWYVSQIARIYGLALSEIAEGNIEKLQRRYPEGFSEEASVNRSE